jgi:outer membrane protein assembly factor BamD
LKNYPFSKYAEDYQMTILRARYEFAQRSKKEVQPERFRVVVDEYYNYKNSYPEGKYIKEADKYFQEAEKMIKNLPSA